MKDKILTGLGLSLLLICYLFSLGRAFSPQGNSDKSADGRIKLRFAHWQLEGDLRKAFDQLIEEYERSHPDVEIEQMAIPEQIWINWLITQLVGKTAPDIIQLGKGSTDELTARFFTPLTAAAEQPNPYNRGTELADVAWRDTFIDGLTQAPSYNEALLDIFAVPSAMFTIRVFYNQDLLREITGGDAVPTTYDEFVALCEKTNAYRTSSGGRILPLAGSKYNAPFMIESVFSSQTQKLRQELSPTDDLGKSATDEVALGYVTGQWSAETPAIQSAFGLMYDLGRFLQPGFLSLGRDDALFYFVQQKALMISTGSWDAASLREQAPFTIGAFKMPLVSRDDPRYSDFMLGPISEATAQVGLAFGLTKQSEHPEAAIDFLRFITSKAGNQLFSENSGWLPSVVGVDIPPIAADFEPLLDGYPVGIEFLLGGSFPDWRRVIDNNLYRLVGSSGSVASFTSALQDSAGSALRSDLDRILTNAVRSAAAKDIPIAAYTELARDGGPQDSGLEERVQELFESQNSQEAKLYYIQQQMRRQTAQP